MLCGGQRRAMPRRAHRPRPGAAGWPRPFRGDGAALPAGAERGTARPEPRVSSAEAVAARPPPAPACSPAGCSRSECGRAGGAGEGKGGEGKGRGPAPPQPRAQRCAGGSGPAASSGSAARSPRLCPGRSLGKWS